MTESMVGAQRSNAQSGAYQRRLHIVGVGLYPQTEMALPNQIKDPICYELNPVEIEDKPGLEKVIKKLSIPVKRKGFFSGVGNYLAKTTLAGGIFLAVVGLNPKETARFEVIARQISYVQQDEFSGARIEREVYKTLDDIGLGGNCSNEKGVYFNEKDALSFGLALTSNPCGVARRIFEKRLDSYESNEENRVDLEVAFGKIRGIMPEVKTLLRGLPEDFAFIPVAESRVNHGAESTARAVGAWQFKRATATENDLRVNNTMDERKTWLSTYGAANFLTRLKEKFGRDDLTLWGYHGGAGRVSEYVNFAKSTGEKLSGENYLKFRGKQLLEGIEVVNVNVRDGRGIKNVLSSIKKKYGWERYINTLRFNGVEHESQIKRGIFKIPKFAKTPWKVREHVKYPLEVLAVAEYARRNHPEIYTIPASNKPVEIVAEPYHEIKVERGSLWNHLKETYYLDNGEVQTLLARIKKQNPEINLNKIRPNTRIVNHETLSEMASRLGVNRSLLISLNPNIDPDKPVPQNRRLIISYRTQQI